MAYFLTDDNVKIYYEATGEGQAVIFVHGWTCNHGFFKKQIAQLSENYKVITYDLRGHGISEIPENGITIARFAKDLKNLIEYLGLKNVVVAGWSMGTSIILEYVRQFGCEYLDKICFIDMTPKIVTDSEWNKGIFGKFDVEDNLNQLSNIAGNWSKLIESFVPSLFAISGCKIKEDLDWAFKEIRKTIPHVAVDCWISMSNQDYRSELSKITVPCLITRGEESAYCTLEAVKYMEKEISDAKLINYSNCGHILFMEEPETFNKDFSEFINNK